MDVYCDVDEVLVDFLGGALKVHGWTREQLESKRPDGVWEAADVMGLTRDEFWEPIHKLGVGFWSTLEQLPWCWELIHELDDIVGCMNYTLLTSPSRHVSSYIGKRNYLNFHFGHTPHVIWNHKHQLAEGNLLIDDRAENIIKWVDNGGCAIMFPHQSNSLRHLVSDPIPYVKQELMRYAPEIH